MCLNLLEGVANARSAFTGLITILTKNKGRKCQPLSLHIKTDRSSSGFIAQSLMSDFFSDRNTTLPKPIDLTHEDPSLVKHYVKWANTRNISTRKRPRWVSQHMNSRPDDEEEMILDIEQLALCYGLGERLEDDEYRNALLCTIRYYVVREDFFPSDRVVAIIYEQTSRNSPARKMMVDFWAYAANPSWLKSKSIRSAVCPEFFEDLLLAVIQARMKPEKEIWPWADNANAYLITHGAISTKQTCIHKGESMET